MGAIEDKVKALERACLGGLHPTTAAILVELVGRGKPTPRKEALRLCKLLPEAGDLRKNAMEHLGLTEKPQAKPKTKPRRK